MMGMGWPAALFLSVLAVLLVALAYRVLEWRHELHTNAVIRAYRAESIEANNELERARQDVKQLRVELEASERRRVSAEVELATAQGQLERRHRIN